MSNGKYKNPVTTTDIGVECAANTEKLVDSDERQYFDKENTKYHQYDDDDADDNYRLDDDVNKYEKPKSNVFKSKGFTEESKDYKNYDKTTRDPNMSENSTSAYGGKSAKKDDEFDPDDESNWTKEEKMLRKLDMMRKLGELQEAGVTLSQAYTLDSDYKTMKYEYELHTSIRAKRNALSWMGNMLVLGIGGMEFLNDNYNPFDLKFNGMWSNNIKADLSNYHDVLGEIYEKYSTPGKKTAPELRLLLMVTMCAGGILVQKGVSNYMAGSMSGPSNLETNPEKFREMKEKADKVNEMMRQKVNEKYEKEHNDVVGKMANLNMLKKQQEEYERMQQYTKPMGSYDLQMSESAKSTNINKKNLANTMQMQKVLLEQQARKNKMAQQMNELADIDMMINEMRDSEAKSQSQSQSYSQSQSQSKSQMSKKKSEETDTVSTASTATSFKNPNLDSILGKSSKKIDTTISLSNSGSVKKRGRPAKK